MTTLENRQQLQCVVKKPYGISFYILFTLMVFFHSTSRQAWTPEVTRLLRDPLFLLVLGQLNFEKKGQHSKL